QGLLLRLPGGGAGSQEPLHLGAVPAGGLVDRPAGHRRLAPGLDLGGPLLVARLPKLFGQRIAGGGELVEGQPVEIFRRSDGSGSHVLPSLTSTSTPTWTADA